MGNIWDKYGKYMGKIWEIYGINMGKILDRYGISISGSSDMETWLHDDMAS
jgi:hypothetical protein